MRSTWKPGWLFLLLTMIAALSLFVAACGDDDDGGAEPTATASEAAEDTGDGDEDDEDEEATPGEDEDEGEDDDDDTDPFADLDEVTSAYSNFEGTVTYVITQEGEDTDGTTTIFVAKKGTSERVDFGSDDGNTIIITKDGSTIICSEADSTCIAYPSDTAVNPAEAFTSFLSVDAITSSFDLLPDDYDVDRSSATIAGIEAECFAYSGDFDDSSPGDESGKYCFNEESGILLRVEYAGAGVSGSYEAQDASEEVDDSVFEPPYPVTTLPGLDQ